MVEEVIVFSLSLIQDESMRYNWDKYIYSATMKRQ